MRECTITVETQPWPDAISRDEDRSHYCIRMATDDETSKGSQEGCVNFVGAGHANGIDPASLLVVFIDKYADVPTHGRRRAARILVEQALGLL